MECALCEDVAALKTRIAEQLTLGRPAATFTREERSMRTSTARHTQTHLCGNTSERSTTANQQRSTQELLEVSETASLGRWRRGLQSEGAKQQY